MDRSVLIQTQSSMLIPPAVHPTHSTLCRRQTTTHTTTQSTPPAPPLMNDLYIRVKRTFLASGVPLLLMCVYVAVKDSSNPRWLYMCVSPILVGLLIYFYPLLFATTRVFWSKRLSFLNMPALSVAYDLMHPSNLVG